MENFAEFQAQIKNQMSIAAISDTKLTVTSIDPSIDPLIRLAFPTSFSKRVKYTASSTDNLLDDRDSRALFGLYGKKGDTTIKPSWLLFLKKAFDEGMLNAAADPAKA